MNHASEPLKIQSVGTRSDGDRATIIMLANALGLVATAIIFYGTYGKTFVASFDDTYFRLCVVHLGLIALFAIVRWPLSPLHTLALAPCLFALFFRMIFNDGKQPRGFFPRPIAVRPGRDKFRAELWVLVFANFLYVLLLIRATGGLAASPFASYSVVMVTLGQFIADNGAKTRILLGAAGVIFFVVLRYGWSVEPGVSATATAALIVNLISLAIGTTITIKRSPQVATQDTEQHQTAK